MPSTLVSVRKAYTPAERRTILEAIHGALVEAIKIRPVDRSVRLQTFAPEDFLVPEAATDRYTLVEISLFEGRSQEAKRALYKAIVRNLGNLGITAMDIRIILNESPKDNWGIRGGQMASDIEIGFKVDV